jgi:cob(I)alamin adenosyltransferase
MPQVYFQIALEVAVSDGASKIYTRGGDKGKTSLIGGARVSKASSRLDAYGTIDELNSVVGLLRADAKADLSAQPAEFARLDAELLLLQHHLFDVGSQLACEDEKIRAGLPAVGATQIAELERSMDAFSAQLKPLKHFVLPGGARSSSTAHIARTVCRRAERLCVALEEAADPLAVQFLNRLSDYLFVLARHLNRLLAIEEPIWQGQSRSKSPGNSKE